MIDEGIQARNVLTIIDRLSKKKDMPLDGFYARLSEYAHPRNAARERDWAMVAASYAMHSYSSDWLKSTGTAHPIGAAR